MMSSRKSIPSTDIMDPSFSHSEEGVGQEIPFDEPKYYAAAVYGGAASSSAPQHGLDDDYDYTYKDDDNDDDEDAYTFPPNKPTTTDDRTSTNTSSRRSRREVDEEQAPPISLRQTDRGRSVATYYENDDDDNINRNNRPRRRRRLKPQRSTCLMVFSTLILCLEVGVAMIAVMYYEDVVECCDESFFSPDESVAAKWNTAMYGIAIGYLVLVVIEIPVVTLMDEPFFLFNPMIGFLLCIHMMYATHNQEAYIMFGLETVALFGQSIILIQMERNAELCLHTIFNYPLCGLIVYVLIELTRQGGYCMVDGNLQTVFQDSTCNTQCIDEASCFVCDNSALQTNSSCFIRFPTNEPSGQ